MEVSLVRKRLQTAIEQARQRAQRRRQQIADAERSYAQFLNDVAIPVARMLQNSLKSEGLPFTLFTPNGTLRLAADRGRNDYVELQLDTSGEVPEVVGHISRTRGSRTIETERSLKPGAPPEAVTESDVLEFLVETLEPWL